MSRLTESLKALFIILLVLQFAPSMVQSIRKQYSHLFEPHTKVALIEMNGTFYSSAYYTRYLKQFFEDADIKAIVLRIDSGGGAAGAGQAIFNEIKLLQKKYPKPIISLSENTLASAAYYIACATDWIITAPSTLVGNIGGTLPHQIKLKEFVEQWKIHVDTIGAGKYKNIGDPFIDRIPEHQVLLQELTDDAYAQFAKDVATSRKLSLGKIQEWGDGKVFTGNQALKLDLINEVGSWSNVLERLKEKALIEGRIEWVKPPQKNHLMTFLGMSEDGPEEISATYRGFIHAVCQVVEERYARSAL